MAEGGSVAGLEGKRVVFVVAGAVVGGAERNALDLAAHLARECGALVAFCALDDRDGRARRIAGQEGIPWTCARTPWVGGRAAKARSLLRAAWSLRRLRPDVLVACTNLPNVVCGLVWRLTGARVAVWTQCDVQPTTRISHGVFRRALRSTPLVVTTASHARDWLVERFGADPARVNVVYSKVELPAPESSEAAWRERLGIAPDDLVACMLGHLHEGKDHPTLLRAWRMVVDRLRDDGRNAVLLVAGRPAGAGDAAKALAFDLDLREHVRFLGDVGDVGGLLEAADLAVFCSWSECLGRGATEPMAAGLAVAGSDIPGIREAVGPAGLPFLAPPGDPEQLAEVILRLARDAPLRKSLGAGNARLIRERQSAARTTEVYAALLASTLANGGEVEPASRPEPVAEPG